MSASGREYVFKTSSGSDLLPIADGQFVIEGMDSRLTIGNCFIQFLDSDGVTPITPSGGTVEFESGVFLGQYLDPPAEATINAITVVGTGTSSFTPPSFDSAVKHCRIVFSGITGATYARATHWRA